MPLRPVAVAAGELVESEDEPERDPALAASCGLEGHGGLDEEKRRLPAVLVEVVVLLAPLQVPLLQLPPVVNSTREQPAREATAVATARRLAGNMVVAALRDGQVEDGETRSTRRSFFGTRAGPSTDSALEADDALTRSHDADFSHGGSGVPSQGPTPDTIARHVLSLLKLYIYCPAVPCD